MTEQTSRPVFRLSASGRRSVRRVGILAAVVGVILGIQTLVLHLMLDPFADTRVYYEAGTRLNAGLPLYDSGATDSVGLYLYPPLLAILFRPLALLPFPVAALIWEVLIVGALLVAIRRVGISELVVLALGWLALPILWALAIGQAEPLVTLALTWASPLSVAFAGNLKLFPWLAAAYWAIRRDWRSLIRFSLWVVGLLGLQIVLEPQAMLDFMHLTWIRPAFDVNNISPFAVHPLLWVVATCGLTFALIIYRDTIAAWPLTVAIAVLTYPRLLVYQLMSLLAAFGGPREESAGCTSATDSTVPVTERTTGT